MEYGTHHTLLRQISIFNQDIFTDSAPNNNNNIIFNCTMVGAGR